MSCSARLVSGKNKGQLCPNKAKENGRCGRHAGKEEKKEIMNIGDTQLPFFGEVLCEGTFSTGDKKGQPCDRKAYYFDVSPVVDPTKSAPKCGIHSDKEHRVDLPRRPIDEVAMEKERQQAIEEAQKENTLVGRKGDVKLYRMKMMKGVEETPGYLSVFPNYRHGGRKDGWGIPELSPMVLGPVFHGQPGLPESKTIEGFHQYSKCYQEELAPGGHPPHPHQSPIGDGRGHPGLLFYANRLEGYETTTPKRRKFTGTQKNKNIPLFFVWVDKTGKEHYLDYVTSRQFYCNFYERLAKVHPSFLRLKALMEGGTNLQICGYDGFPIPLGNTKEEVEKAYLDSSVPFGHERVLYTMLLLEEQDYPWRKYKTFDF